MSDETQDRSAVLSEAYDRLAAEPAPEVEPVETAPAPAPEVEAEEPAADTRTAAERARDEQGRFAKADKKPTAKPAEVKPDPAKPAEPVKPAAEVKPLEPKPEPVAPVKAPQSWKPNEREAFAKAPPEVQQAALRREAEITRTLNETAEARKTVEQVQRTLAPYETIARANGMDTMQYAGSVMQTAAVLHMGSAQQKAALVAQLIGAYGIDVDAVNAVMQGQPPQAHAAPQQPPQDVSRLVQQEFQRRAQAASEAQAAQAWEEFQASSPEFLADVKEDMRFILEREGAAGRKMTYQQAYDRAVKLNEDVSAILAQRKAAEAAKAQIASTQRTRAAASSVKPTPAAAVPAQPADRREVLSRRFDELST
jgi:hypothetical protein